MPKPIHSARVLPKAAKHKTKTIEPEASIEAASKAADTLDLEEEGGPIAALLSAASSFSELNGNYRERVHKALASIYTVALFLENHADAWQDFCRHPNWNNFKGKSPTILDTPDKLQPAIRFALGFDDKAASKTASKYHSALSYAYQAKVPPERILNYLNDGGGIEELAAKAAQRRRAGVLNPTGQPTLCILTPLDAATSSLLSTAPGSTVKCQISIMKSDGIGQLEAKVLQIKKNKGKKAGQAKST